jgi:hypothetical protein
MKVNRLKNEWTSDLGGCVELPAEGHVVAVQCPAGADDALFTILHEAVHVWQAIMSYMQEDAPGPETEAYTIEHIAKELMLQYQKVTGETLAVLDQRKKKLQKREREVQLQAGECQEASGAERSSQDDGEGGVGS